MRIATLNLYHYAAPGVFWYRREATHSEESWAVKNAWLRGCLDAIDADIVGFQEVVSIEALRALCAEAGYPHFAAVAEPRFLADDRAVYKRPVNAVASRWPMSAEELGAAPGVARTLSLDDDDSFRRPVVKAAIETPAFGPVLVYCCHLKSPGVAAGDALMAGRSEAPEEPRARARWRLEALSRAHGRAQIQRMLEASLLYHEAAARVDEAPGRPLFILGDFNDAPESAALMALTPHREFERDGAAGLTPSQAEEQTFRLIDAWRLAPRDPERDGRPPTHREGAEGVAIDFILTSSALHPWAPHAIGRVVAAEVHDGHFQAGHPALSSDHAPVSATIAGL